jgi:hypothetical protein
MKKILVVLGLGISFALSAIAAPQLKNAVSELNAEIERLLTPFQDENTKAFLNFRAIETDAVRATEVKLDALFRKIGTQNIAEVKIEDISYSYGNGETPTTNINGSLGIDITKILPQETLNEIIPGVEEMVLELAKDFAKEYGDAATIDVKVTDKTTDENGNFVTIKATMSGNIDLTKLPAEVKVEDVLFTSAGIELDVNLVKGISFKLNAISNPAYKGFQEDQEGLKEMLEKLLARDAKQMQEIESLFKNLNETASQIVNGQSMR